MKMSPFYQQKVHEVEMWMWTLQQIIASMWMAKHAKTKLMAGSDRVLKNMLTKVHRRKEERDEERKMKGGKHVCRMSTRMMNLLLMQRLLGRRGDQSAINQMLDLLRMQRLL